MRQKSEKPGATPEQVVKDIRRRTRKAVKRAGGAHVRYGRIRFKTPVAVRRRR